MRIAKAILVALVLAACTTPAILKPGPDAPKCGYQAIDCGGGMCCDGDNVACGTGATFNGCPAGMCCEVDASGPAMMKRRPVAQRRAD